MVSCLCLRILLDHTWLVQQPMPHGASSHLIVAHLLKYPLLPFLWPGLTIVNMRVNAPDAASAAALLHGLQHPQAVMPLSCRLLYFIWITPNVKERPARKWLHGLWASLHQCHARRRISACGAAVSATQHLLLSCLLPSAAALLLLSLSAASSASRCCLTLLAALLSPSALLLCPCGCPLSTQAERKICFAPCRRPDSHVKHKGRPLGHGLEVGLLDTNAHEPSDTVDAGAPLIGDTNCVVV